MQNSTVKVEGFDDLFKAMDELAEEIGKGKTDRIWRRAMAYAFNPVVQDAEANAPQDTGQLEQHVYMKVQRPQARDRASASYRGETFIARVTAGPKREESVEHTVITKKGKEKVWHENPPVAISQEFGNATTAPKPFLRPALERNIPVVIERLGKAVWYEITWGKWAKGKGKT
jgi:HK97 gp10 family phage protein